MYDDDAPSEEGVTSTSDGRRRPVVDDYEKARRVPAMFMQKHSRFRIHSQYEMVNWVREATPSRS